MKKGIILVAIMAACAVVANAQPRAIGGRLGAFDGVSYQHSFGDSNMLEVELGFNFGTYWGNRINGRTSDGTKWHMFGHDIQAAVTYDWIDPFGATFPWDHKGEWHWYLGVGGAGGYGWYGNTYEKGVGTVGTNANWGFVGGAGRAGVEYDFWFPLQLSIDYRPTLGVGLIDDGKGGARAGCYWDMLSLCLGVRYKF
ncbi:MAG: hypothetical protein IJ776_08660 [Paludibacteraceae bacterium]|nr:hypothetical protein [Paludibacteraceae bacterium]